MELIKIMNNFTGFYVTPQVTDVLYYGTFHIPTISSFFNAILFVLGVIVIGKIFWMCVYEIKYNKGFEYLHGEFKRPKK
jgi:Ni,Fe-hydrogenase I cytochrome b subunit